MKIPFSKYHGAGNDFIFLDNRNNEYHLTTGQVALLCHRRFGIGADGLMLVERATEADFRMVYFNSDGRESSFCGNGGRCIADYAFRDLKMVGNEMKFVAVDGQHKAVVLGEGLVVITMQPVKDIFFASDYVQLDTGSPHYVKTVKNLSEYPVVTEGRNIRHLPEFEPHGINVNFVESIGENYYIRTYERGVEDETYACGTGVTAAAIALAGGKTGHFSVPVISKANYHFQVDFDKNRFDTANNIMLKGAVEKVFEGIWDLR